MKIWAIQSGSCYDCSCDHLVIPSGMNLEDEKRQWRIWYRETYCPDLHSGKRPTYISFIDHLRARGATDPTSQQLEVWEDV